MKTFERYTEKLNEKEKTVYLPWFIAGLGTKVGKDKKITGPKIIEAIFNRYSIKLGETQVRKIIAYIRDNDLLPGLIADQNGYHISKDPKEIQDYIESLEAREAGFRSARLSMERYLMTLK